MGLTADFNATNTSYTPPFDQEELPPGGLPEDNPPNLEAAAQAEILSSLPGEVAAGVRDFAIGTLEGAVIAVPALAVETLAQGADTLRLPVWLVRHTADQAQQFLQSGIVNAYRYGPAPAFNPKVNIEPPALWSAQLQDMERGRPSLLHEGAASPLELGVRQTVGITLAEEALHAVESGDARELGRMNGGAMGLALAHVAWPKAATPPLPAWMAEQAAAATPPSRGLTSVRSPGPLTAPPVEGELALLRIKPPLGEQAGEPPHARRRAAIDSGMGGADDGEIPSPAPKSPLNKTSSKEEVMNRLGVDAEQFDVAVAAGDSRLAGTRYDDPVAKNRLMSRIVSEMTHHDINRPLYASPKTTAQRLNDIENSVPESKRAVSLDPQIRAMRQFRVNAIESFIPELKEHISALEEAGLSYAGNLAADALQRLTTYRDMCLSVLPGRKK